MANGIIIVNKPQGWTSHDVVAKLRGVYREKRIGHGGTLDPMATGVLPVFVGRATRAAEFMESADKVYEAGLLLGLSTDTQDTTGTEIRSCPVSVTQDELLAALARFTGHLEQIPPMYSAVKIGGKKLYQIARKGGEVERKPRPVEVYSLELLNGSGSEYMLRIHCSKGLYVRTLCSDIGDSLGCGGCMSSLVRTRAGDYSLSAGHTMEDILAAAQEGRQEELLLPVDSMFNYEKAIISPKLEKKCLNGAAFPTPLQDGTYKVYSQQGQFLMLGRAKDGQMYTIKSFFEV